MSKSLADEEYHIYQAQVFSNFFKYGTVSPVVLLHGRPRNPCGGVFHTQKFWIAEKQVLEASDSHSL